MELGLAGLNLAEDGTLADREHFRRLNATWAKTSCDVEAKWDQNLIPRLEAAREAGIRVVVDLRADKDWIQRNLQEELVRLEECGELEPLPEDDIDRRLLAAMRNQNKAGYVVQDRVAALSARAVFRLGDLCDDYEVWGESKCPWVSGGCFGEEGVVYSGYLAASYRAVKEVKPGARIWTGGNGMDLEESWLQAIIDDGHAPEFDVCNWHPYFMRERDFDSAGKQLAATYSKFRKQLDERGKRQPFACTEWGYPSSPPNPWGIPDDELIEWLDSRVVQHGVRSLSPSEVCRWYERDLAVMYDFGFEVVIIHSLRDAPEVRFWGDACGLLTHDGEEKPVYEVARRWGERLAAEGWAFQS